MKTEVIEHICSIYSSRTLSKNVSIVFCWIAWRRLLVSRGSWQCYSFGSSECPNFCQTFYGRLARDFKGRAGPRTVPCQGAVLTETSANNMFVELYTVFSCRKSASSSFLDYCGITSPSNGSSGSETFSSPECQRDDTSCLPIVSQPHHDFCNNTLDFWNL